MKNFFKYTLATFLGSTLGLVVSFLIVLAIIFSMIGSTSEPIEISANTILKIKFNTKIVDRAPTNPFEDLSITSIKPKKYLGLNVILKEIKRAATDDNIKGIYMNLTSVPAGIATIEEIRNALLKFKESGKFILAYSEFYTQSAYYLASVADKLYLNPVGELTFKGLNAEIMFYTNALRKFGVEPQIIRHGKFKSAVEPFMLEKMSDANREQTMTYMGSIWGHLLKGISKSRGISVDDLNMYADSMMVNNADAAKQLEMIDDTKYYDEIEAELKELTETAELEDLEFTSISNYHKSFKLKDMINIQHDKIAIIYASGEIKMEGGNSKTIGNVNIPQAIKTARLDTTVKAIVLRVNSPGGSALVSDVIWREVKLAKKVKPIIVSMGDVAASGGYYISCPADRILASENTITGSIGVFGLMFNAGELLTDKIGITIDRVKTNAHSDLGSTFRKLTASERQIIQKGVHDIYGTFISHVGEGRGKTTEEIDAIGQGRVWSGENAIEIGLIDEFGGLERAIEVAKETAGLKKYSLLELPEQKEAMEEIISELTGKVKTSILEEELGVTKKYYDKMQNMLKLQGVQARIPYDLDIY